MQIEFVQSYRPRLVYRWLRFGVSQQTHSQLLADLDPALSEAGASQDLTPDTPVATFTQSNLAGWRFFLGKTSPDLSHSLILTVSCSSILK